MKQVIIMLMQAKVANDFVKYNTTQQVNVFIT